MDDKLKHIAKSKHRRFRKLHDYFIDKYGHSHFLKIAAILIGIIFLVLGIVMLITPGPGILFIVLGIACFSLLSGKLANYLDRAEAKIRQLLKKIMRKKNKSK